MPDRSLWVPGYAAAAGGSLLRRGHSLDEALGIVRPFADPLLDGTAAGLWDRRLQAWTGWTGLSGLNGLASWPD